VINKPGWLVCHPSKRGPLSSLVGAVREYTGLDRLHLVARLDRETSGLVILAKNSLTARKYQTAIEHRRVAKTYLAVLSGELQNPIRVNQPIGACRDSAVHVKQKVTSVGESKSAVTHFEPLNQSNNTTFCTITPETGRRHQIRVHAQWLGHPVVADKIYGADEKLFIEFIENGWTQPLAAKLPLFRHALHCYRYRFEFTGHSEEFSAEVPGEMQALCSRNGLLIGRKYLR
jgi:23S rRNA pseudouridine1911/1915/1917 synthase